MCVIMSDCVPLRFVITSAGVDKFLPFDFLLLLKEKRRIYTYDRVYYIKYILPHFFVMINVTYCLAS